VKAIRFGDGNSLTNFYNAENRLNGARLPSGTLVTNFYDFAGRITNRQAKVNGVTTETASYEYNLNDAVTVMTDNTGNTTNAFDAAGRLSAIIYPTGARVSYGFDVLGRVTSLTNKASANGTAYVTRYGYDATGNITNVTDPFNGVTTLEYDRVGRRTKRTLPNNVVTEWQYDWRDRVTNIVHRKVDGTVLASFGYVRNAGGEPSRITREDGTYVLQGYDAALRLTN
jgi:YD repeat-containing protein